MLTQLLKRLRSPAIPLALLFMLHGCASTGGAASDAGFVRGSKQSCLKQVSGRAYKNACSEPVSVARCQKVGLIGGVADCSYAIGYAEFVAAPSSTHTIDSKYDWIVVCGKAQVRYGGDDHRPDAYCVDGGPSIAKEAAPASEEEAGDDARSRLVRKLEVARASEQMLAAAGKDASGIGLQRQVLEAELARLDGTSAPPPSPPAAARATPKRSEPMAASQVRPNATGPGANAASASPGGFNVAQAPRRERVNVPGHLGCISVEAVPRQNQNLTQTHRVRNGCPMPLRVHYCYGNGCTKALGAGEEIASGGVSRLYVERSYGYVLRLLQACSLMSGTDRVGYSSDTNQCSAVITMQ